MPGIPFIKDFKFDYGTAMEVTPLIRRVVAHNPSPFTFKGTGTYIIGHGKVAIVDPGPDDREHIDAVLRAVRAETVTHILVTHTHIDHMGWSTAVISPPDGNMADYFASLRKLLPRGETLYIPTHGAEIRDPNPFVQAYIEHRLGREAQIMARLKEGPQKIPQMVAKNYADTPIHLHAAAGRSMLAHLIQMVKDGRAKTEDGQARIDSTFRL